jgi:uncharacterized membrane protein YdjX (TVP38/TMEM64 family)
MVDQFGERMGAAQRPESQPGWFDIYFWPFFPQVYISYNCAIFKKCLVTKFLAIVLYDFRHISIYFQALRQSPFRWPILIVLILLIIGFAIFMARRWAKSRQTTEYTPGTLAGRTKA